MNSKIIICILIFLPVLLLFDLSCDKDDPTEPVEPDDHLFFIADSTGGTVRVFSVEKRKIIDSVIFPNIPQDKGIGYLHVIGNDEKLLTFTIDGAYIMNLKTGVLENSITGYSKFNMSPNSEYFLGKNASNTLWELRKYDTQELVYSTNDTVSMAKFSNDSKYLAYMYGVNVGNDLIGRLKVYDIENDSVINNSIYNNGELTIWWPYPVSTYNKVFYGANNGFYFYCATASDIGSDSARILKLLEFQTSIIPQVSPDDKYVFAVVTPSMDYSPFTILVFDAASEELVAEIPTRLVHQASFLTISHDSKYFLSQGWGGFLAGANLIGVFNAKTFKFLYSYDFGQKPGCIATKR